LEAEFGPGFTKRNLFNMMRFAETFSEREIVHALSAKLGWTHFRRIIYLDDPLQRDFYAEMCRMGPIRPIHFRRPPAARPPVSPQQSTVRGL
jgi:hypothetical protein